MNPLIWEPAAALAAESEAVSLPNDAQGLDNIKQALWLSKEVPEPAEGGLLK